MKKIFIIFGVLVIFALIFFFIILPRLSLPPKEKITISVPFDKNNPPQQLIPMGETLEHPKPDNPKGHSGVDLLWSNEQGGVLTEVIAVFDGEITSIFKWEEGEDAGEWDISIRHGNYLSSYGHFKEYDQNLSEGDKVTKSQYLGKGSNIHFEFGYYQAFEPRHPDRVCFLSYLDEQSRKILEAVPIMEKHKAAGFDEICAGDYKE